MKTAADLATTFEGCKLIAYLCPAKHWTIGFGHTGRDVYEGLEIDYEHAVELLRHDLCAAYAQLDALGLKLLPNKREAVADFIFNEGIGRFLKSTLLKELRAGDYQAAAHEFLKWDLGDGHVILGLERRRSAEMNLFLDDE